MALIDKLPASLAARLRAGSENTTTSTVYSTPWEWRTSRGVYVSHSGSVWLYRKLPTHPVVWEDNEQRLAHGGDLHRLLLDLGETSRSVSVGPKTFNQNREFHLLSLVWEEPEHPPEGTPERLAEYLNENLGFLVPHKALFLGVRLWPSSAETEASLSSTAQKFAARVLGEDVPDMSAYTADLNRVEQILIRANATKISEAEAAQLESWYNRGNGTDAVVIEERDHLVVEDEKIEMVALMKFTSPQLRAPSDLWLLDAQTYIDGPEVVSIRGALEPAKSVRQRVRRSQRKLLSQMDEEAATGDIERVEFSQTYQLAKGVEDYIVNVNEPVVTQASVILGCRTPNTDVSYIEFLKDTYGIVCKPLEMRQLASLEHTLPGSVKQVNPFPQDLNVAMLAYSGAHGFSNLGDPVGLFTGLVHPDFTACYLDPYGAPRLNLPAITAVFGDSGSGKAQPLDAKILTPTGWTTMGNLAVGDLVVGSDGQPHAVTAVYPQGDKDIYRVTFSDGSSTETCAEHLWAVRRSNYESRGKGWDIRQTSDLAMERSSAGGGPARWFIPVAEPVEFTEADLPLDPYLVGALIGDGGITVGASLSSADSEVVENVASALPADCTITYRAAYDWSITKRNGRGSAVRLALEELGLLGVTATERRVPEEISSWPAAQRRDLVRGMRLAAEEEAAIAELTVASMELAHDLARLVDSVGGHSEVSSCGATAATLRWKVDMAADVETSEEVPAALIGALLVRGQLTHSPAFSPLPSSGLDALRSLCGPHIRFNDQGSRINLTDNHNSVVEALRGLGLHGRKSDQKFIPRPYLFASIDQRQALLQGLLDTDGEAAAGKSVIYTTVSSQLADDVEHLTRSLGGTTHRRTKTSSYRTVDGERRTGLVAHAVTLHLPDSINPFRLARKADATQKRTRRPARGVVAVDHVGVKAAQCIAVDAADHLYVTDDFVVTHNTFLAQHWAFQCALAKVPCVFINPKGKDSLAGLVELAGGERISMRKLTEQGGAFDPFRFCFVRDPKTDELVLDADAAADVLSTHVLDVVGDAFPRETQIDIRHGILLGARAGAMCGADAIAYIEDQRARDLIMKEAESNPLFALGIGNVPQPRFDEIDGLTLIEFDRELPFPEAGKNAASYTSGEISALAAVRLVSRASMEILAGIGRGGALFIDEAHTFLAHSQSLAAVQRLGREGRSLNMWVVALTQRPTDLLGRDMESYLSRVFCLKMTDDGEAKAALTLCGLEPTKERVDWLKTCNAKKATEERAAQPAQGIFRDLYGRHAAVWFTPVLADVAEYFSTNPEERRAREDRDRLIAAEIATADAETAQMVADMAAELGLTEPALTEPSQLAPASPFAAEQPEPVAAPSTDVPDAAWPLPDPLSAGQSAPTVIPGAFTPPIQSPPQAPAPVPSAPQAPGAAAQAAGVDPVSPEVVETGSESGSAAGLGGWATPEPGS